MRKHTAKENMPSMGAWKHVSAQSTQVHKAHEHAKLAITSRTQFSRLQWYPNCCLLFAMFFCEKVFKICPAKLLKSVSNERT